MGRLLGLWMIDTLPLPILIGAGLLLAIASNREARIRLLPRQRNHGARPDEFQASTTSHPSAQAVSPQSSIQLPEFDGRSPATNSRSISFKINE